MNELNILIVEDEIIIYMHIKKTLRTLGFKNIHTARSSEEALTVASKIKIDILFSDIKIDGFTDGIDTAHALQSLYGVPVIFITAYKDKDILRRVSKIDTIGYLLKPYRVDELEALIHLAIAKYELTLNENLVIIDDNHRFNKDEQKFYYKKKEIPLTKKEKLLISTLVENLNNYVSYELIERIVWFDESVVDSTKRTFISRARLKFPELSIKTQRSLGIGIFTK